MNKWNVMILLTKDPLFLLTQIQAPLCSELKVKMMVKTWEIN